MTGLYGTTESNAALNQYSGTPYGGPQVPTVGSPEYAGDVARIQAGRTASSAMTPEQLDSMKWSNWSSTNGFAQANEAVQRQLVKQYHDNVIPYVASSLNEEPSKFQNLFITTYPREAALIGTASVQSEVQRRTQEAADRGLSGAVAQNYILTGEYDPKLSETYKAPPTEAEQRRATGEERGYTGAVLDHYIDTGVFDPKLGQDKDAELRATRRATGEERGYTGEVLNAYIDTGKYDPKLAEAQNTVTEAVDTTAIDSNIEAIDDTLRNIEQINTTMDKAWLPTSGPLTQYLAKVPSAAASLRGYLTTLRANQVFDQLSKLRMASKDGSSGLGQITVVELNQLASKMAALDADMLSDEQLAAEVEYIRDRLEKSKQDMVDMRDRTGPFAVLATRDASAAPPAASGGIGGGQTVDPAAPAATEAPLTPEEQAIFDSIKFE